MTVKSFILSAQLLFLFWQPSLENILYIRSYTDSQAVIVSTSSYFEPISLPSSSCLSVSPTGDYIVYSDISWDYFLVLDLITNETISEIVWAENWLPCNFLWINENNLVVRNSIDQTWSTSINIFTQEMQDYSSIAHDYLFGGLPDVAPNSMFLPSPTENMVLYELCPNSETYLSFANEQICSQDTEIVLFDTEQNDIITTIPDTSSSILDCCPNQTYNGIVWSPDGNFFIYRTNYFSTISSTRLRLYDISNESFIELPILFNERYVLDDFKSFSWSPSSRIVVFWLRENSVQDRLEDENTENFIAIYNLQTNQVTISEESVTMSRNHPEVVWSMFEDQFAFVNLNNVMYSVEINGELTEVDDDVLEVIKWQ